MGSSTALTELTMQKYQRMQTCADVQRRSAWRPPYALTTALELLSIEVPRISSKHKGLATTTIVAVPHANDKRHIVGVKVVVWPFPLDTVIIEGQFTCTSPACTWAMFSTYLELEELIVLADSMMRRDRRLCRTTIDLELEELIVLADSMMRRDRRLCRTTIDALSLYLDEAEAQVRADKENGTNSYLFRGYNKCRRALLLARAGTDSSMETRTRLALLKYGLNCPQVNYPIFVGNNTRPIYLDLAYPEFKICIEYEGSHHAGQWLNDARRRQMIEDAGWKYIQVTKLDIGDEAGEEALARRVAERIQEVTGKTVQLTMRQTTQQISDVRKLRRIPLYKRLKFEPLLPIIPTTQE